MCTRFSVVVLPGTTWANDQRACVTARKLCVSITYVSAVSIKLVLSHNNSNNNTNSCYLVIA